MRITKYGHACLLIEEAGVKFLIDPGVFNASPSVEGIDALLITHEHQDHIDVAQVRSVLAGSPGARVITHEAVGKILDTEGIAYELIKDGETVTIKDVPITSYGVDHAAIYESMPTFRNTGFMIAHRFYFPGDSFHVPGEPVEILALPTGGPWMKQSESIEFARTVAPKYVIPVHDAMYTEEFRTGVVNRLTQTLLGSSDTQFRDMKPGSVEEF